MALAVGLQQSLERTREQEGIVGNHRDNGKKLFYVVNLFGKRLQNGRRPRQISIEATENVENVVGGPKARMNEHTKKAVGDVLSGSDCAKTQ
mmetsp:Transcript_13576/g.28677  ORF Transcript_13576/g.28677 Transcript_13576/m.28677 type:complete len:92 (-) Transcript_13576:1738-2013(-)